MAIALEIKQDKFKDDANIIEFSVVDIAAAIGWNSGVVKYQLKNLEWIEGNLLKLIYGIVFLCSSVDFTNTSISTVSQRI